MQESTEIIGKRQYEMAIKLLEQKRVPLTERVVETTTMINATTGRSTTVPPLSSPAEDDTTMSATTFLMDFRHSFIKIAIERQHRSSSKLSLMVSKEIYTQIVGLASEKDRILWSTKGKLPHSCVKVSNFYDDFSHMR